MALDIGNIIPDANGNSFAVPVSVTKYYVISTDPDISVIEAII